MWRSIEVRSPFNIIRLGRIRSEVKEMFKSLKKEGEHLDKNTFNSIEINFEREHRERKREK